MKKAKPTFRPALLRVSRLHVILGLLFAIQIIIYDAWKLITPDIVLRRWVAVAIFVIISSICWFVARTNESPDRLKNVVWLLILTDIAMASWFVYLGRGMASRAVLLYVIPILTSAILVRKGVIYLTGVFCVSSYVLSAVAYFVLNFNEGYKIELYGEITFYSVVLFVITALTWSVIKAKNHHRDN